MMKVRVSQRDVPLTLPYTYSRAHDTSCALLRVELEEEGFVGRGEGAPFESFFGTPAAVALAELEEVVPKIDGALTNEELLSLLRPGPARNALDAALWDLKAKRQSTRVWRLLGMEPPKPVRIMTTISLAEPGQLLRELEDSRQHPILKLKLGDSNDIDRLELTRKVRPNAEIVVDVNGAWDLDRLRAMLPALEKTAVQMVEQPVHQEVETGLRDLPRSIPLIADESFSEETDLDQLMGVYDGINIKLDKCGGLTAALRIIERARAHDLRIMVGCLPATSLSSAVGFHVAPLAEFVDLDNHLWVAEDVQPAMSYDEGWLRPPLPELWG